MISMGRLFILSSGSVHTLQAYDFFYMCVLGGKRGNGYTPTQLERKVICDNKPTFSTGREKGECTSESPPYLQKGPEKEAAVGMQ